MFSYLVLQLGRSVCQDGYINVTFIRHTMEYSGDEEFTLLFPGTRTVVYNSGIPRPNVTETKYVCISRSPNYQYDLEFTNEDGPWEAGSWLEIRGIYNNRVFRSFFWSYPFRVSLLNPINKNDEWYWTTEYYQDWYFMTSEDWSKTVRGALPSTNKPHFFRKTFSGLQDMAAYEVQFYYKHGIVAYLNGIEIYRDNMPKGIVLPSTKASNVNPEYQYKGVIRNGQEAAETCVLAVEIHTIQEEAIEFDCWLGLYASSRDTGITLKVYPVPVYSATFEGGTSMEYAYDDNINSVITFSIIVQGETYFEYYTQQAQVTMWSYYSPKNGHAMTRFRVHGQMINSEEWSSLSTTTPYNIDEHVLSFIYTGTHLTPPSYRYRIYPLQSNGLPVYVGEMQPYVYGSPLIQEVMAVEFQEAYELTVNVYVSIQPTYWSSGFTCLAEPELPEGLVFNQCSIEGTPTGIQRSKTYYIYMHGTVGTRRRTTTITIVEKVVTDDQGIKGYVWVIIACAIVALVLLVALWMVRRKSLKAQLPIVPVLTINEGVTTSYDVLNPIVPQVPKLELENHQPEPITHSIPMSESTETPVDNPKPSELSVPIPQGDPVVPVDRPAIQESEFAKANVPQMHSPTNASEPSEPIANPTLAESSDTNLSPLIVTLDSGLVINVNSLPPEKRAEIMKKYNL